MRSQQSTEQWCVVWPGSESLCNQSGHSTVSQSYLLLSGHALPTGGDPLAEGGGGGAGLVLPRLPHELGHTDGGGRAGLARHPHKTVHWCGAVQDMLLARRSGQHWQPRPGRAARRHRCCCTCPPARPATQCKHWASRAGLTTALPWALTEPDCGVFPYLPPVPSHLTASHNRLPGLQPAQQPPARRTV